MVQRELNPQLQVLQVPIDKQDLPIPHDNGDSLSVSDTNLVKSTGESTQINYNYFGFQKDKTPVVNVYPIINVPQSKIANIPPVVINVNINLYQQNASN